MSEQGISKRNVFLDTQVYVTNNFDFTNRNLTRLVSLANENRIILHTTTITIGEIKANILNSITEAKKALKDFQKTAKILRNCHSFPFFQKIWDKHNYDAISADLIDQLDEYLKKSQTNFVPLDGISIQNVFNKYFSTIPPFKDGEKKHEFPDAFAIAALELWSIKNGETVYIISGDNDWRLACDGDNPHFIWLEKPEVLFQLIEFDNRLIEGLSETFFAQCIIGIKENVKEQFESLGFFIDSSNFSRTVDDEHVEKVEVRSVELINKYLVSVNHQTLSFNCEFDVEFKADIHYEDYTNGVYDDEEGLYIGESIEETNEYLLRITVDVEIAFSSEDLIHSELRNVTIQEEDLRIMLEDADKYPYK